MTSLSKYYQQTLDKLSCGDLFHPTETCTQACLRNSFKILPICAKFFAPLVCIQFLRYLNNYTDKELIIEHIKVYALLTIATSLGSWSGQTIICLFNTLLGGLYIPTVIFLPTFIGNCFGFFMPEKVNNLITNYTTIAIVESYFRNGDIFALISKSKTIRTILFMIFSATIITTNKFPIQKIFWFISSLTGKMQNNNDEPCQPSLIFDKILPIPNHICAHSNSCDSYIINGIKNNIKLGLGLEIARCLVSNISQIQKSPLKAYKIFYKMKFGVMLFLVSYNSSFRLMNCALNRYKKKITNETKILSAFLSGATYFISPNLAILSHATVTMIKMLWYRYTTNIIDDTKMRKINKILARFFYILTIAYAFHLRAFYPWMSTPLMMRGTEYGSGFNANMASLRYSEYLLGMKSLPVRNSM